MNSGVIYLISVLGLIFLFILSRSEKAIKNEKTTIYRYPSIIKKFTFLPVLVLPGLGVFVFFRNGGINLPEDINEIAGIFLITLIFTVAWMYMYTFKITLTDNKIIKNSVFGRSIVPYSSVNKIVMRNENSATAVMKVYGCKIIRVDSLLTDFDELKEEIIYLCDKAELIEK